MANPELYESAIPAEELERYCPGGYHPTLLHDTLKEGRYEILYKLGFGAFSTVWLAHDHDAHRNVSIKILDAESSAGDSRELGILQHLSNIGHSSHPGSKHVAQLRDWFYHEGPNGKHLCLVLALLGPRLSLVAERSENYRIDGKLARKISRQLLLATNYLHNIGIAHGDIHTGNVLIADPALELLRPEELPEKLDDPETGKVTRVDGAPLEAGIPDYLVVPLQLDQKTIEGLDHAYLADFGESFWISSPPESVNTPTSLHPPELVFQRPLTQALDLWSYGFTTFELVTGCTLFQADKDCELIPQFRTVIGDIPTEWFEKFPEISPDGPPAAGFIPLEEEVKRSYLDGYAPKNLSLNERALEILRRFLREILVIKPELRPTSQNLIHHEWLEFGSQCDVEVNNNI